jgi:hypothetical protein
VQQAQVAKWVQEGLLVPLESAQQEQQVQQDQKELQVQQDSQVQQDPVAEKLVLQEQQVSQGLQDQGAATQALQALLDQMVLAGLLDSQAQQALLALREQLAQLAPTAFQERQELQDRQVVVARQGLRDLLVRLEQLAEWA